MVDLMNLLSDVLIGSFQMLMLNDLGKNMFPFVNRLLAETVPLINSCTIGIWVSNFIYQISERTFFISKFSTYSSLSL